jgi:hypothetical protein
MANETADQTGTLLRSVTRMLDIALNDGSGYDSLIPVLSLVCLVSILNRGQSSAAPAVQAGASNPLQKLLGDLGKGEGGLGPDTLMSLLPLLNSPQFKNKINPTTISAVMSLLGTMGNMGDKSDKSEKAETKADKSEKPVTEKVEEPSEKRPAPPAAAVTSLEALQQQDLGDLLEADKRGLGRYLNWKNNF